jgi:putative methyltransferase
LAVRPGEYGGVGAILLDPTCSGSGCVDGGRHPSEEGNDGRLKSLSRFQTNALLHAMSFPGCRRIVYSTCSVHDAENEHVVAASLKQQNNQGETESEWSIVAPRCLSGWKRRGRAVGGLTPEQAKSLVRVDPSQDHTGGFFVACLERHAQGSVAAQTSVDSRPGSRKRSGASVRGERSDSSSEKPGKTPKRARDSTTARRVSAASDGNPCADPDAMVGGPALPKKRLKKLQWKRQQREEKQRRLLEKTKEA